MKKPTVEVWPKTETLTYCGNNLVEDYFKQAQAFIEATGYYQSVRGTSVCAVAEYIAYMDGYTIRNKQT